MCRHGVQVVAGQQATALREFLGPLDLYAEPPFDRRPHEYRLEEAVPAAHRVLLQIVSPYSRALPAAEPDDGVEQWEPDANRRR